MFRHPKYYKELKEFGKRGDRGKPTAASPDTDQAISLRSHDGERERSPGPGLKLPGPRPISNANKGLIHRRQASSVKPQAPEDTSDKRQAPGSKRQA